MSNATTSTAIACMCRSLARMAEDATEHASKHIDATSTSSRELRGRVLRSLLYPASALRRAWHKWRYAPRLQMMETLGRLLAEDPVVRVGGLPGRSPALMSHNLCRFVASMRTLPVTP